MSRDAILAKVRAALQVDRADRGRNRAVAARLEHPPDHPIPRRGDNESDTLVARFRSKLKEHGAEVITVQEADEVPAAIVRTLRASDVPLRVRSGSDPHLAALPWQTEPDLVVQRGKAEPDDRAGLSRAIAGIAETGTLVLASGPHNPVTLGFVPDTHLVVVAAETIVAGYEDASALLAAERGPAVLPRTLNFIAGPSRTGDIGGKIVMGAHGPRRLAVILVGSGAA
jgi:L-lactate dehydrogenase complex protein LldG